MATGGRSSRTRFSRSASTWSRRPGTGARFSRSRSWPEAEWPRGVPRPSTDPLQLTPRTALAGAALDLDFPGLEIGCAEYDEGPTGCTVFHFPDGASVQTDIRGGSPGTFGGAFEWVNAICLAG